MNAFLATATQRQKDISDQEKAIAKIKADNQAKIDKHLPEAKRLAKEAYEKEMGTSVPTLEPVATSHTGGIITESGIIGAQKGEIIIDDVLVNTFKTAAEVMSGMKLMNLQRQAAVMQTQGGSPIIISNAPTTQVNQNQAMILPPSPIQPGNVDTPRLTA